MLNQRRLVQTVAHAGPPLRCLLALPLYGGPAHVVAGMPPHGLHPQPPACACSERHPTGARPLQRGAAGGRLHPVLQVGTTAWRCFNYEAFYEARRQGVGVVGVGVGVGLHPVLQVEPLGREWGWWGCGLGIHPVLQVAAVACLGSCGRLPLGTPQAGPSALPSHRLKGM